MESVSSRPPEARVAIPPATEIPQGEVACPDNPEKRCLSDRQNADLLRRYENRERSSDRQMCWLRVWFGYKACEAE